MRICYAQGRNPKGRFTGCRKRFPARGEELDLGACAEDALDKPRTYVEEVLAIVEHDQQRLGTQILDQGVNERGAQSFADPKYVGRDLRNEPRIVDGCEVNQPNAIGKIVE